MPPFNPAAKIPKPPRPAATAPGIARAPWEREDDDEHGPPPALDLSPGEAEAEARRMIYDRKHPMHDAIVQGAHINHNHAMRRYTSLMRRAWDPAARNMPVQDLDRRSASNVDDVRPTPLQQREIHNSRLDARPTKLGNDKGPDSPRTPLQQDNRPPFPPLAKPADIGRSFEVNSVSPRYTAENEPARPPELPRLAREKLTRRHATLSQQEIASRPEQIRTALEKFPTGMRTSSLGLMETIPHQQNAADWATIGQMVLQRKSWSDTDQYVHRYILGFEGLSYDESGRSKAGIQTELLRYNPKDNYLELLNAYRAALRKAPIASETDVRDLALQDLLDAQRVYLAKTLHPKPGGQSTADWVREVALNDNLLGQFGPPDIATQIADTVYQHGSKAGSALLQIAVNAVLAEISPDDRARLGMPDHIDEDGVIGTKSQPALRALANDQTFGPILLREIREQRVIYTHRLDKREEQGYTGATINRIWSIRHH